MKPQLFLSVMLAASVFFSCSQPTQNDPTPQPDPTAPGNLVTLEDAKLQIDKYKKAHPDVAGDQYALHTWVSIEDLEAYLAYIKFESKKLGITVTGIDLIHTQSKDAAAGLPNKSNADYGLTLMYAPTFDDNGKNVAFDPLHSAKDDPATLQELFSEMDTIQMAKSGTEDGGTEGEDQGTESSGPTGPSGIANRLASCPEMCD